ncbi:hypothetical protein E4O03_08815 [Treponema sp. OMZ 792]|uniref:hypothetical protein n=1 Tax=unclassified Treponema TaxID=2638727 RepID=UPI0020A3E156|nr:MULTISPECIES: hypothetical protein [unclassified Treponema]UTC74340.1 hypothetical protein E4O03_08815 [Treponema sp. OMZ 792]UTC80737.1 hypothetical protein E4O07_08715 [Treponema sp. OMZ 798]
MSMEIYHKRKKNIIGLQIYLIAIILFLSGCSKREIIWRNYSSVKDFDKIKLLFVNNNHSDIKEFNLTPQKNNHICIPHNYSYVGYECEMLLCLHIYEPFIGGRRDKIEVFIFDLRNFTEDDEKFIVNKKDYVIAYLMEYFNPELKKGCTIFSKDNILYKQEVIYGTNETLDEILNKIEEKDYLDYAESLVNLGIKNNHNGYIVQSKIDNRYIWFWTN